MKRLPLIAFLAFFAVVAPAQDKAGQAPKTKLEAFEAKTGAVLIKGIQEMGSVVGTGSVEVDCREFTDAASGKKEYGITIRVIESGRLERSNTTLIDYDEIESLLKGIEYISKVDKSSTKLSTFEAIYKTKGDLRIITFSNKRGEISSAIESGSIGRATAYFSLAQLEKAKTLIENAKVILDDIQRQPK